MIKIGPTGLVAYGDLLVWALFTLGSLEETIYNVLVVATTDIGRSGYTLYSGTFSWGRGSF